MFFTHENTYDAYVHMFFASHYAENWFETWNYKWYTGFTITSYPPLVHQMMALLSKFIGLKLAFVAWGFFIVAVFIRGVYHFSKLFVHEKAATYAAFAAVFSFSFMEALHVFGQLPSITGIAFILNACPELYKFFRYKKWFYFFSALSLIAVTTAAHHVSTIFGAVFFIAPIIGLAVLDNCAEQHGGHKNYGIKEFINEVKEKLPHAIIFGVALICIVLFVVFPYWYWSKTDPITQVPIPHGSRGNFIADTNLGIVFFLIPWGFLAFILPYFFIKLFNRRNIFLGLSFSLAFLLGTGGTTPIPKWILGEHAFSILTLDRFTFWASLMALPFWGFFIYELFEGELKIKILRYLGSFYHKLALGTFSMFMILASVLIVNLNYFRPLQPAKIDINPIVKFLNTDDHNNWRYLTLGFGDQVAWLSANTNALSVDGNYHSARRLPEMTSRPVERLENSKYLGMAGLGALQQFLTIPEKYHLKYIFSNDKFYDPLLYFSGWEFVRTLDNNISIWEKPDIPPLPTLLPKKVIPKYQSIIWGFVPIAAFLLMLLFNLSGRFVFIQRKNTNILDDQSTLISKERTVVTQFKWWITGLFFIAACGILSVSFVNANLVDRTQLSPEETVKNYYHNLDFRNFEEAYSMLSRNEKPSIEQYMLETTIEDGLLASFAKLDSIEILKVDYLSDVEAKVFLTANWITSIMSYQTQEEHFLEKKEDKWYLKHQKISRKTPPDNHFSIPNVSFLSQGRRTIDVEQTDKRDVMDRPEVYVIEAKLVKKDSSFFIVGELQNVDDIPAYISIMVSLFDDKNEKILSYNARDVLKHHLMPKEVCSFRVDFEEIAWQNTFVDLPKKFDPEFSNPFNFQRAPTNFKMFVKALASDQKSYENSGLQNVIVQDERIMGQIQNYGVEQISIPLLISSWYDQKRNLRWVENAYQKKGIRSQRNKDFSIPLPSFESLKTVYEGQDNDLFVNGIRRSEYGRKLKIQNNDFNDLQFIKTNLQDVPYFKLQLNNFINR